MIRHHRLIESYLAQALGMPWDRVHDEAEVLEHYISEELEERMSDALGDPNRDPHGDPIPSAELDLADEETVPLVDLRPGSGATSPASPTAIRPCSAISPSAGSARGRSCGSRASSPSAARCWSRSAGASMPWARAGREDAVEAEGAGQ